LWPGTALGQSFRGNPAGRCDLVPSWREALAWRSANPTAMTHIAIVDVLDGKSADWMEQVSDKQYRAAQ